MNTSECETEVEFDSSNLVGFCLVDSCPTGYAATTPVLQDMKDIFTKMGHWMECPVEYWIVDALRRSSNHQLSWDELYKQYLTSPLASSFCKCYCYSVESSFYYFVNEIVAGSKKIKCYNRKRDFSSSAATTLKMANVNQRKISSASNEKLAKKSQGGLSAVGISAASASADDLVGFEKEFGSSAAYGSENRITRHEDSRNFGQNELSRNAMSRSVSDDGACSYLTYASFNETVSVGSPYSICSSDNYADNSATFDNASEVLKDGMSVLTELDDKLYCCSDINELEMDSQQFNGNTSISNKCYRPGVALSSEYVEYSQEESRYFDQVISWLVALIRGCPAQIVVRDFVDLEMKELYGVSLSSVEKWIRNESPDVHLHTYACDGVQFLTLHEKGVGVDLYVELERTQIECGETPFAVSTRVSNEDFDEDCDSMHHDLTSVTFQPLQNEKWLLDAIRNSTVEGVLPWNDVFLRYQEKSCILSSLLIALGPDAVQNLVWNVPPRSNGMVTNGGTISSISRRSHSR